MAKKHSPDRKPYSPVDAALMRSLPTIFGPTVGEESNHAEVATVTKENMALASSASMEQEPTPASGVPLFTTGVCTVYHLRGTTPAEAAESGAPDEVSEVSGIPYGTT